MAVGGAGAPVESGSVSVLVLASASRSRSERRCGPRASLSPCSRCFTVAHGKELPSAADPISYSAGCVGDGLLHVSGICLGFLNDRPNGMLAREHRGLIAGVALVCIQGMQR